MARCDCSGHEATFTTKVAEDDLRDYLRHGPDRTTRELVAALRTEGVDGASVIDVGGGIGALGFELLAAGAARVTSVDASSAYVETARREAARRGTADRIEYRRGDFVELAPEVPPADLVTLARVVCCYGDMPALLGAAAGRAGRAVGLVYPRDAWWTRFGAALLSPIMAGRRDGFRFYVHRERAMDEVLRGAGFERRTIRRNAFWQVAVYDRVETVQRPVHA
jgi:magnesium-protoporphyrin O-methyltransferase